MKAIITQVSLPRFSDGQIEIVFDILNDDSQAVLTSQVVGVLPGQNYRDVLRERVDSYEEVYTVYETIEVGEEV